MERIEGMVIAPRFTLWNVEEAEAKRDVPVACVKVSPPFKARLVVVAFNGNRYAKVDAPNVAAERQAPERA